MNPLTPSSGSDDGVAAYRPRWHFGAGFFKGFGLGVTLRPTEYDIVIGPWTMWVFYE